jgi:hypothetical protein
MTLSVRDAGAWKSTVGMYVRDAGAWKTVQQGYVRDAGTWKLFVVSAGDIVPWSSGVVTRTGYNQAPFSLNNDGTRTTLDAESGSKIWLTPQIGMNQYDVFATFLSGTLDPSSSLTGVWLNLGTSRFWAANRASASGPGITAAAVRLTIRRALDQVTVFGPVDVTMNSTN